MIIYYDSSTKARVIQKNQKDMKISLKRKRKKQWTEWQKKKIRDAKTDVQKMHRKVSGNKNVNIITMLKACE